MFLTCLRPFGNFTPGDTVEVPDNAVFDTAYFSDEKAEAPAVHEPLAKDEPAAPEAEENSE